MSLPNPTGARSPGVGVSVAAAVGFLVFVELTSGIIQGVVPMLLPKVAGELDVSAADLSWVSTLQLLSAAVSVPLFGRLGDLYGHRRLLRVAAVCLAIGTVLVAWSPSFGVLLFGRVLQGPLAALLPLEIGIVRDRLDPEGAKRAVGLLVGALTFGGAAGMIVAGTLDEAIGNIHGVLWVPAAATILCVVVVFTLVPESTTRAPQTRVDWAGAGLLSFGLAALLLAIARGPEWGWTSVETLGLFALSAVILAVWVLVELRVPEPIVDVRLSVRRTLLPVYVASMFLGAALFGAQTAGVVFMASPADKLGYGFGYDTLEMGWASVPSGLAGFVGAMLAATLARFAGPRGTLGAGGALMAAGYVSLVAAHGEPWQYITANGIVGLGTGICMGALPGLVMDASPADRTGIATGIYNTFKTLGGSIAGAAFAAILAAITLPHTKIPTEHAFVVVWWCCAGVCLLIAVAAAVISRPAAPTEAEAKPVAASVA
jgi:MFS family permease